MMQRLRISSCMAPNMETMVAGVADWLAGQLDRPVEFVQGVGWRQREAMFDRGEIDMLWICGLPYVWKADDPARSVRLVAAPVMAAERYQDQPVYFSDVVVAREAPFQTFADLAQARWAINEPNSHSGYNLTRYYLAEHGLDWTYFRSVLPAGSHEACLMALLAGDIDAAAIDSTVLEQAVRSTPALQQRIRIIETFGPSPIPPWIAGDDLQPRLLARLRAELLAMAQDQEGCKVLASAGFARLVAVDDRDYDPIRRMEEVASKIDPLEESGL